MWRGPAACRDGSVYHRAAWEVARVAGDTNDGLPEVDIGDVSKRHADATCADCGSALGADGVHGVSGFSGTYRVYDTPSGEPEPGSMYWATWYSCATGESGGKCFYGWTNCDGKHLMVVLPNGHGWDVNSRASNCTMKDDGAHRCWVRHGDPDKGEPVHVDKAGNTCAAGAGSIAVPGYHGFLHNGELSSC
jgi:hypothetical protein